VSYESPKNCHRCDLWKHATQAVLGEGAAGAGIMLVGEQPGDEEDMRGHPFVGLRAEGERAEELRGLLIGDLRRARELLS
jgi:uracil-DNA glycosylase family 4